MFRYFAKREVVRSMVNVRDNCMKYKGETSYWNQIGQNVKMSNYVNRNEFRYVARHVTSTNQTNSNQKFMQTKISEKNVLKFVSFVEFVNLHLHRTGFLDFQ